MDTASEAEPQESRTEEHNKPNKKSSTGWSPQLQKGSTKKTDVSNKKRMDISGKEPKPHPATSPLQHKNEEKAARENAKYLQQEMKEKIKVDNSMNLGRDGSDNVDKISKSVKHCADSDAVSVIKKPKSTSDCDNSDISDEEPKSMSNCDSNNSDNEKPKSDRSCDSRIVIKPAEDCSDADEETKTEDEDPLNVDLYEKLCVENNVDQAEIIKWDKYVVGDDLQRACKWLSCSEKQFYTILMSIFAAMTFAMVLGLFILQAQMSMNSREIVSQMQSSSKKGMPQGMYTLYFDYLESSAHMPDKVDLRANTSIFVH